jgi:hypothetical protein
VRVLCTEDHEEFTANFFCTSQRSGICVMTELAVMDACAVVADRGTNVALECGTEGEVAADAETDRTDFPRRDFGMFGEPVLTGATVGIEMRDRSLRGVLLAAGAPGIVKWDHRPGRFNAAINLGGSGNKSIPSQPYASAEQGRSELKNVGKAPDSGILTFGFRRSNKGPHRVTRHRNVRVFGGDDHRGCWRRVWRSRKNQSTAN